MTVATAKRNPPKISAKWRKLFALIPGYDPCDQAGDCTFHPKAAQQAIDFFHECITHVKGDKAGQPFILEPWQRAIHACIFGWKRPDGTRRYREVFLYVASKNGKTAYVAGVVLMMLACDTSEIRRERGAEIYSAASSKDQASLVFSHAVGMVRQEPFLSSCLDVFGERGGSVQRSIVHQDMRSSYNCLSADEDTADGANVHMAAIDELHRHKSPGLANLLRKKTASRSQPLIIYTSTADYNRPSLCNTKLAYAKLVRGNKGKSEQAGWNPAFLPVIYEARRDDDWESPATWRKANPNMGVTFTEEFLAGECRTAKDVPSELNGFLRFNLNIVTDADEAWIDIERWDECGEAFDVEALRGRECFGGLDLSSTTDLTAFVLVFPGEDSTFDVLPFFWTPATTINKRERKDRVPYRLWRDGGFLEITEGDVVDQDVIRRRVGEIGKLYTIREVAIDRWNSAQLQTQLMGDGLTVVPFGQGYASMTSPTKRLEELVLTGKLRHGGHPVLRWCAGNVTVERDTPENIKPSKKKSTERIDGIVALIMALGRAIVQPAEVPSFYESEGIETIAFAT